MHAHTHTHVLRVRMNVYELGYSLVHVQNPASYFLIQKDVWTHFCCQIQYLSFRFLCPL